jgi:hypothetical protein
MIARIFVALALCCFLMATIGVHTRIELVPLGLAFYMGSKLVR